MTFKGIGLFALVLCGAAVLSGGCGYRAGFLIPAGVETVHVRMPVNETFWREALKSDNVESGSPTAAPRPAQTVEADLAERLTNEIVRRTPLHLAEANRADTVLETKITRLEPSVLLRNAEDEIVSQRVTVTVDFRWVERRTGRVIASGGGISRPTDYNVARGESLTTATRKSLDFISERVVEQMREGF